MNNTTVSFHVMQVNVHLVPKPANSRVSVGRKRRHARVPTQSGGVRSPVAKHYRVGTMSVKRFVIRRVVAPVQDQGRELAPAERQNITYHVLRMCQRVEIRVGNSWIVEYTLVHNAVTLAIVDRVYS